MACYCGKCWEHQPDSWSGKNEEAEVPVDIEKLYGITEIFYSLQGEGGRAGEPSIFIRFSGCNMACDMEPGPKSPGGFMCDTEFVSKRMMSRAQILAYCKEIAPDCKWVVFTGGEPGLQLDLSLVNGFRSMGYLLAIETNGTVNVDELQLDWICVSPKVAEHAVKQLVAHEVKYVRSKGQGIPVPACKAPMQWISPAFSAHELVKDNLEWCIKLCLENPEWRLSVQNHNLWKLR